MNKIFPYGVRQCVMSATHLRPRTKPSLLDVCYTTDPDKMASVQAVTRGASEHRMIVAMRKTKSTNTTENNNVQHVKTRASTTQARKPPEKNMKND